MRPSNRSTPPSAISSLPSTTSARCRAPRSAIGFDEGPRLGVSVTPIPGGLRVDGVDPAGPADKAGIRVGDILTSVDGQSLTGPHSSRMLIHRLRGHVGGDEVAIETIHEGQPVTTLARLEGPTMSPMSTLVYESRDGKPWLELELTAIHPQQGQYFGVNHGVLVLSSKFGSLGLKGGDVLLRVGGEAIEAPTQALRVLGQYSAGDRVSVEVRRNGQLQVLAQDVPVS